MTPNRLSQSTVDNKPAKEIFYVFKKFFGQRLLEIRKRNHETQQNLAEVLGMAKSRISDMEKGRNTTTLENLALICKHYNVSADYLLSLSDDPTLRPPAETILDP